jgi:hypothetical protein
MAMVEAIVGAVFVGTLVLAPLAWRVWQDRRVEAALTVRAQMHAEVVRALGGESLVSVNVQPASLFQAGRIELSAPSDWRFLLEPAWSAVMRQAPSDWELIVRPLPAATGLVPDQPALPRAA